MKYSLCNHSNHTELRKVKRYTRKEARSDMLVEECGRITLARTATAYGTSSALARHCSSIIQHRASAMLPPVETLYSFIQVSREQVLLHINRVLIPSLSTGERKSYNHQTHSQTVKMADRYSFSLTTFSPRSVLMDAKCLSYVY